MGELEETERLLSSPKNAVRLEKAISQLNAASSETLIPVVGKLQEGGRVEMMERREKP